MSILEPCPGATRFTHDHDRSSINISTTSAHYTDVIKWLSTTLAKSAFPFHPEVKRPKFGLNQKSTTPSTKYSTVFKSTISVTDQTYASTIPSNAWKHRPPVAITYVINDPEFPPMPPPPTASPTSPDTKSTTSETYTETTFQQTIDHALRQLETTYSTKLSDLETKFQSDLQQQITSLEKRIDDQFVVLTQQLITTTYSALTTDTSPLLTKTDHLAFRNEINLHLNLLTNKLNAVLDRTIQPPASPDTQSTLILSPSDPYRPHPMNLDPACTAASTPPRKSQANKRGNFGPSPEKPSPPEIPTRIQIEAATHPSSALPPDNRMEEGES